MNFRHLQFFVELAKTQHMAKAAELLNISQPSLSYAISSLEQELGVPLFEKEGRNIRLTNFGRIYLKYAQRSLDDLRKGSDYLNNLMDVKNGHINLGFTFTMGQELIPKLVREFLKQPEYKNITFSFAQGTTDELVQQLLDEKLDLVFTSAPQNFKSHNQLTLKHLVNQEIVAAVPLSNPLSKKDCVTLKELTQYPLIAYSDKSGLKPTIKQMLDSEHIKPKIEMETIEDHTIIGFVRYNFGVAIIPHLPLLASNQIKLLHLKAKKNWHEIYTITKANYFMPPSAGAFKYFVDHYCKEHYLEQNKLI